MNYIIDAQTGKVMEKYNQIDSIPIRNAQSRPKPLAVEGSAAPNATIPDQGTVNSSIKLDQDVDDPEAEAESRRQSHVSGI